VSQGVLGICLLYGIEIDVDYAEAYRWLSAAADQRASRPTLHLAHMHQKGLGIPVNVQQAIKLYTSVAKPSDSTDAFPARIELGRIFATGSGVPVDQTEALKWYSAALAVASEDDEADEIDCKRLERADQRRRCREEELGEHNAGYLPVEQEVIPVDHCTDKTAKRRLACPALLPVDCCNVRRLNSDSHNLVSDMY